MMKSQILSTLKRPDGPDKDEKEVRNEFAKATLGDFGQILAFSAATGKSVHRIRLEKLREISGLPLGDTVVSK
jgi:hypothetical protein